MEGLLLDVVLNTNPSLRLQSILNGKSNILSEDFVEILEKLMLEENEVVLKVLVSSLQAIKDLQEDKVEDEQVLLELMAQFLQGEISLEDGEKDRQIVTSDEGKTEVKMVDQVEGNVNYSIKFDIDLSNGLVSGIDESKGMEGNASTLVNLPVSVSSGPLDILGEISSHVAANVDVIGSSETENINEDVPLVQNNVLKQHHSNGFASSLMGNEVLAVDGIIYDGRSDILENGKMEDSVIVRADVLDEPRVERYRTVKMEELLRKYQGEFSVRFGEEHNTISDPITVVPISADDWEADTKKLVFVKELVEVIDEENIDNKDNDFATIVKDHNSHSRKHEVSFLNKFDEIVLDRIKSTYTSNSRFNGRKIKDNDDLVKELSRFFVPEKDQSVDQSDVDNRQTDKIVWDYKYVSRSDFPESSDFIDSPGKNHIVDRMMSVVNLMKLRNKYPSYMMMKIDDHVIKIKLSFDVEHGKFFLEVLTNKDVANVIISHRDALLNAFLEKEIDISSLKILVYQENNLLFGNYNDGDLGYEMNERGSYFANNRDMKKYASLLESIYSDSSGLRDETSSNVLIQSVVGEYKKDSGVNVYV